MIKQCRICLKELHESDSYWESDALESLSYICHYCYSCEPVKEYLTSKEICTRLWADVVMWQYHHNTGIDRLRVEVQKFYIENELILSQIASDCDEITAVAHELEVSVWLPKLKPYYEASDKRGHCGETEYFKVLLWGSAGRVLLTIQDCYSKQNKKSKFHGAWITLIFSESSLVPIGGIQALCATKDEAIGLIKACIECLPDMQPNNNVILAGL